MMFRKVLYFSAGLTVFILGSYTEMWFQITPLITAFFETIKMLLGDTYAAAAEQIPREIDTTSALVAVAGFGALISFGLIRARRM